jgi:hypothetical protein
LGRRKGLEVGRRKYRHVQGKEVGKRGCIGVGRSVVEASLGTIVSINCSLNADPVRFDIFVDLCSFENLGRMRGLKPEEKRAADAEVWRGYVHFHFSPPQWVPA